VRHRDVEFDTIADGAHHAARRLVMATEHPRHASSGILGGQCARSCRGARPM
jgi:hypothetical protein